MRDVADDVEFVVFAVHAQLFPNKKEIIERVVGVSCVETVGEAEPVVVEAEYLHALVVKVGEVNMNRNSLISFNASLNS